jgi:hypothetical protein
MEPGKCYKICVMMLDKPYPGMVALTTADGQSFEFVIPESGEAKIVIILQQYTIILIGFIFGIFLLIKNMIEDLGGSNEYPT